MRLLTAIMILFVLCLIGLAPTAAYAQPGTLDPSFGEDGTINVTAPINEPYRVSTAGVDDGSFYVVGHIRASNPFDARQPVVARFEAGGQTYPGFGNDGVVTLPPPIGLEGVAVWDALALPDGRLYVVGAGASSISLEARSVIGRVLPNGEMDPTYGTDGWAVYDLDTNQAEWFKAVAFDGSWLYVGGDYLCRIDEGGTMDPSFGTDGAAATPGGVDDILIQPDAKPVVVRKPTNGGLFTRVVRFLQNGQRDPAFGDEGLVELPTVYAINGSEIAARVVFQDGRLLVAERENAQIDGTSIIVTRVTALSSDGSIDETYGDGGSRRIYPVSGPIHDFVAHPDGTTILFMRANSSYVLVRLTPEGSVDATFGGGVVDTGLFSGRSSSNVPFYEGAPDGAMALQANGSILVLGRTSSTNDYVVRRFLTAPQNTATEGEPQASHIQLRSANPVRGSIAVWYETHPASVQLSLFDLLGREIRAFEGLAGGIGVIHLDLSGVAPGTYFLRLRAGSHQVSRTVTVLR